MANRNFTQFQYGLEKKKVSIYATVLMNGTTVNPTLRSWSTNSFGGAAAYGNAVASGAKGVGGGTTYPGTVIPIVYVSAGLYTVYFQDRYIRLLDFDCVMLTAAIGSCPFYSIPTAGIALSPAVITTCPSVNVQYYAINGTATSPTAAETHLWRFDFADSSAP